jgi:hypothetical protein
MVSMWELNGWTFTNFTNIAASCSTERNFGSRSHDTKASLWMNDTMYKFRSGNNFQNFSSKAFLMSCQSCCSVCTDTDAVCSRNIFYCGIAIHGLEYITPCISLWKRWTEHELFWIFSSKHLTNASSWANPATSVDPSIWRENFCLLQSWSEIVPWCFLTFISCVALLCY